jgi:hypothetical protein
MSGFSFKSSASDDVRDQQLNKMTTRELIGAILESPIDMLVSGSRLLLCLNSLGCCLCLPLPAPAKQA